MGKPVIIIGAGGHARVLLDCLRLCNVEVLGAVDKYPKDVDFEINILGDDSAIASYLPDDVELVNGLGSVENTGPHISVFERFKRLGYNFCTLVHPSAVVAKDCILGEGVQIMAGVVINTGTKIFADSIINTGAIIDHECIIGHHVHIAPGCTLSGGVQVGVGSHIGVGTTIIQGIKIGEHALVGAGSVVIRDVSSRARVAGVPAKIF